MIRIGKLYSNVLLGWVSVPCSAIQWLTRSCAIEIMYGQVCDVRALLFVPKHKRLVCSLKLLHPDSGDPSGVRWSVSRVQPSQLMRRLRAISLSSTMFHTFFFGLQTDLPCKKKKKNSTNNLGVMSCHSSSAKQSQVELWERASPHPVQACLPYRGVAEQ